MKHDPKKFDRFAKVHLDYNYLNPLLTRYNGGDASVETEILIQLSAIARMYLNRKYRYYPADRKDEIWQELLVGLATLLKRKVLQPQPGMIWFVNRQLSFHMHEYWKWSGEHVWYNMDLRNKVPFWNRVTEVTSRVHEYCEWVSVATKCQFILWQVRYQFRIYNEFEWHVLTYILQWRIAFGKMPDWQYIEERFGVVEHYAKFLVDYVDVRVNIARERLDRQGLWVAEEWKSDSYIRQIIGHGELSKEIISLTRL